MTGDIEALRDRYESTVISLLDPKNTDEHINFWDEAKEEDPDKLLEIRKQNAHAIKHIFLLVQKAQMFRTRIQVFVHRNLIFVQR